MAVVWFCIHSQEISSRVYSGCLLQTFSNLIRGSCRNRKIRILFVGDSKGQFLVSVFRVLIEF